METEVLNKYFEVYQIEVGVNYKSVTYTINSVSEYEKPQNVVEIDDTKQFPIKTSKNYFDTFAEAKQFFIDNVNYTEKEIEEDGKE